MAVKIDRETLAITTLVGAMMIYFFTRKAPETLQEQNDRQEDEECNELEQALNDVTAQYDALREPLYGVSSDTPLEGWISDELNEILRTCHQLRLNAQENTKLVEEWWTRLEQVVHGAEGHLRSYGASVREKEAFESHDRQGTTKVHQTLHVTKNVLYQQNVDRRSISLHREVDNRKFAQINQRVLHMPQGVTPTGPEGFLASGMSGNAAIRDSQQHNSLTTTNVVEQNRPRIVGRAPFLSPLMIQPVVLRNDVVRGGSGQLRIESAPDMLAIEAPGEDSMDSAPAEVSDNRDKPPAVLNNQIVVHAGLQANTIEESFDEEGDGSPVVGDNDPLGDNSFDKLVSEMDGLIDAYAAVGHDQRLKAPYTGQKAAIEALMKLHDGKFNEGPHASKYLIARQRWFSRMKQIKTDDGGIERKMKQTLTAAEQRAQRRGKSINDQRTVRDERMNKFRRQSEGHEGGVKGVKRLAEELSRSTEELSQEIRAAKSPEPTIVDLTGGKGDRRLLDSDFIQ